MKIIETIKKFDLLWYLSKPASEEKGKLTIILSSITVILLVICFVITLGITVFLLCK